jgi:hypothetical protein
MPTNYNPSAKHAKFSQRHPSDTWGVDILTGYQNTAVKIHPKGVTPQCLNRGASSGLACGEHSRTTDKSIRE